MLKTILSVAAVAGAALAIAGLVSSPVKAAQLNLTSGPAATVPVPPNYREWVFLTSGFDMTYNTPGGTGVPSHSVFDNVFVNPQAYRTFLQTGTWPDDTTFVLENREAQANVSINKAGRTQGAAITGVELHVKRKGDWAFYVRGVDGSERLVAKPAGCYTCHEQHAAVDTTFVQFYPTLLPLAESRKTLSANYLRERAEVKPDAPAAESK